MHLVALHDDNVGGFSIILHTVGLSSLHEIHSSVLFVLFKRKNERKAGRKEERKDFKEKKRKKKKKEETEKQKKEEKMKRKKKQKDSAWNMEK